MYVGQAFGGREDGGVDVGWCGSRSSAVGFGTANDFGTVGEVAGGVLGYKSGGERGDVGGAKSGGGSRLGKSLLFVVVFSTQGENRQK